MRYALCVMRYALCVMRYALCVAMLTFCAHFSVFRHWILKMLTEYQHFSDFDSNLSKNEAKC